jgi:hypothetical protein
VNRNRYCSFQNYIQLFIAEPKSKELCNAVLYQRWKIRLEIQIFWRLIYKHNEKKPGDRGNGETIPNTKNEHADD